MIKHRKIFFIKLIHSIVFFFIVACLVYIFYCAVVERYDWTLLIALAAVVVEGLVLFVNRGNCPFTSLARKYGDADGSVTNLFIPLWFARRTFTIGITIFVIELVWLAWGYWS